MLTKNEVKYIISLSDKKNRDREGVFVAEGPRLVDDLLAGRLLPKTIYTTEDILTKSNSSGEIKHISQQELQRISRLETANQVVAVFYKKDLPSYQLQNHLSLALDGIQDPGNLGTLIRTADWFGISQIFASKDTADCYASKVVQSTMGSLARVNIYYTELPALLSGANVLVYGAMLEGESVYQPLDMSEGILIIGNEANGIRSDVLPFIKQAITIPRLGGAESLNAAVATGILLSHLVKGVQNKNG